MRNLIHAYGLVHFGTSSDCGTSAYEREFRLPGRRSVRRRRSLEAVHRGSLRLSLSFPFEGLEVGISRFPVWLVKGIENEGNGDEDDTADEQEPDIDNRTSRADLVR